MNIRRNIKSIMILKLAVIIILLNSFLFAQEKPTKNVLILNSYSKGFVQTDNIVKGIESVLEPKKNSIDLIIEYMDSKVIEYGTQYKEKLYDLYDYKYGKRKFDLIISSDDNAFDFLREYHENLFPDTPIVFCGVNNVDAPNLIDHNVFTGILEVQSVRETIDLAVSLHPETRKIVFIVDDTPTGLYFWSMAQELFKYYEDIRMIHFDSSLSMAQIENKVSRLSDDTILYFGTFHRDKDGTYYSSEKAVSRVSKASAQPMYGNSVQVLPHGIVGGKLFGGFYHGQVAAEIAQRILKGEKVRDISVLTEPQTQYMFNYEQLELWNIKTSDLPEGSIIINKPSSFYEKNKILIWSVIVFVILQMLIIISLIMNITKRRKAETQIKHLNLILRSVRNVNQLITKEKDRNALLKKSCEILIQNKGYYNSWIALFDQNKKFVYAAESGCGEKFKPLLNKLKKGELTVCGEKALNQTEPVLTNDPFTDCKDCPLSGVHEGKGGITFRLEYDHKIYGIISASIEKDFLYDKKMRSLFQEVSEDIAFALYLLKLEEEQKKTAELLMKNEKQLSNIIEHSTNIFYSYTPEHIFTYMSPQVKEILGYEVSEVMIKWTELASDNPINEKGFELTVKAIETGKPQPPYELEFIHKNGKKVWIEVHEGPVVVDGKTISIVGAITDITERRQAEEALRKSEQELTAVLDNATMHIWAFNGDRYSYLSKEWYRYTGQDPTLPRTIERWTEVVHPDDLDEATETWLKAWDSKGVYDGYFGLKNAEGEYRMFHSHAVPVYDEKGNLLHYQGYNIDITDRKKADEELEKYREHLEELVKERTTELEEKNTELERFNDLFANREFRIKELRDKVKELEKKR